MNAGERRNLVGISRIQGAATPGPAPSSRRFCWSACCYGFPLSYRQPDCADWGIASIVLAIGIEPAGCVAILLVPQNSPAAPAMVAAAVALFCGVGLTATRIASLKPACHPAVAIRR